MTHINELGWALNTQKKLKEYFLMNRDSIRENGVRLYLNLEILEKIQNEMEDISNNTKIQLKSIEKIQNEIEIFDKEFDDDLITEKEEIEAAEAVFMNADYNNKHERIQVYSLMCELLIRIYKYIKELELNTPQYIEEELKILEKIQNMNPLDKIECIIETIMISEKKKKKKKKLEEAELSVISG